MGDEDCILPSKLQAALQEVLESREEMLERSKEDRKGGQYVHLARVWTDEHTKATPF